MIKCGQVLESGKSECGKDICCCECEDAKICEFVCDTFVEDADGQCFDAVIISEELVPFERKHLALIQETIKTELEDAAIKKKKETLREAWKNAMEEYNVKSCAMNNLKVTYVAETQQSSIDTAKLKKERPDIAQEYTKVTNKKAYVKVEVK